MLHYNTDLSQRDNGYDFADRGTHDGQSYIGLHYVKKKILPWKGRHFKWKWTAGCFVDSLEIDVHKIGFMDKNNPVLFF